MKITSGLTNLTTAILILTVQMFFEWTLGTHINHSTNCDVTAIHNNPGFLLKFLSFLLVTL
jgi:hypothetical protein